MNLRWVFVARMLAGLPWVAIGIVAGLALFFAIGLFGW